MQFPDFPEPGPSSRAISRCQSVQHGRCVLQINARLTARGKKPRSSRCLRRSGRDGADVCRHFRSDGVFDLADSGSGWLSPSGRYAQVLEIIIPYAVPRRSVVRSKEQAIDHQHVCSRVETSRSSRIESSSHPSSQKYAIDRRCPRDQSTTGSRKSVRL